MKGGLAFSYGALGPRSIEASFRLGRRSPTSASRFKIRLRAEGFGFLSSEKTGRIYRKDGWRGWCTGRKQWIDPSYLGRFRLAKLRR